MHELGPQLAQHTNTVAHFRAEENEIWMEKESKGHMKKENSHVGFASSGTRSKNWK